MEMQKSRLLQPAFCIFIKCFDDAISIYTVWQIMHMT